MIVSFANRKTARIAEGTTPKGVPADLVERACRKIGFINVADTLQDLRSPPGNRLELLKGDREGQHSIRVNDQWRICFVWNEERGEASDVDFCDYH